MLLQQNVRGSGHTALPDCVIQAGLKEEGGEICTLIIFCISN